MPRLNTAKDLAILRESLQREIRKGNDEQVVISIGMGTCGQAAGADEIYKAVERELEKHNLKATIRSVGCIGMCAMEPLVDVQLPGQPRITYAHVKQANVPRIIEEHIVNGQAVLEWAIGFVPLDW